MNWLETIKMPKGNLEIIVQDHKTGEVVRHDSGHNQIQDWARHALSFLMAGRLFCTWGNHGETFTDVNLSHIPHFKDNTDGTGPGEIETTSPWTYSDAMRGLIQIRTYNEGDLVGDGSTLQIGTPLYPFFPTKMRFGIGGLDADQNPKTGISTSTTKLQNTLDVFPFITIDRTRAANAQHISLSEGSIGTINKVTFSVKLPGGGTNYPYDGYVISEAGLFCDAALKVTKDQIIDNNMRTGTMMAYRTFYGISKNESIDITFNWTFAF
jgi:hypothetical protein